MHTMDTEALAAAGLVRTRSGRLVPVGEIALAEASTRSPGGARGQDSESLSVGLTLAVVATAVLAFVLMGREFEVEVESNTTLRLIPGDFGYVIKEIRGPGIVR